MPRLASAVAPGDRSRHAHPATCTACSSLPLHSLSCCRQMGFHDRSGFACARGAASGTKAVTLLMQNMRRVLGRTGAAVRVQAGGGRWGERGSEQEMHNGSSICNRWPCWQAPCVDSDSTGITVQLLCILLWLWCINHMAAVLHPLLGCCCASPCRANSHRAAAVCHPQQPDGAAWGAA
jgi:hypothetical protein